VVLGPAVGITVVFGLLLLAVAWGIGVATTFALRPKWKRFGPARTGFAVLSLLIYAGAGWFYATHLPAPPLTAQQEKEAAREGAAQALQQEKTPLSAQIALIGSCEQASLPVQIPAGSRLALLPTNENYIKSNKWGIYDVPNNGDKTVQFPDAHTVKIMSKEFPPPLFAWKCTFSNHGSVNLAIVSIPVRVDFMSGPGPATELPFSAMVGPIDAGASSAFYVVNDCPTQVATILPETARVIAAGQTTPLTVPLQRPFRNPIEQITILFPSSKECLGVTKC
jgi:hypothetical protein